METYSTIEGTAVAEIVEKRSRFICTLAHVETDEQAVSLIDSIKAEHRTARHNCYAYRLRADNRVRYSDDGEPARTAGLPILSVLEGAELQDIVAVVTRYFGGVLLGTGGLVRAYSQATHAALDTARIMSMEQVVTIRIRSDYPSYDALTGLLARYDARIEDSVYTDDVLVTARMITGRESELLSELEELYRGHQEVSVSEPEFAPFAACTAVDEEDACHF